MKKKLMTLLIVFMLALLCVPSVFSMETKAATKYPYTAKVVNTDKVNVRSGPGTNYKKLGTLKKNTKVTVYALKKGFYKVKKAGKFNNKYVYICKDYLKKVTTTKKTTVKYPVTGTVTGNNVYVRTGPSTSASIKGFALKGDKVVVSGKEGDFYAITFPEKFGNAKLYISSSYVQLSDKLEATTPATPAPVPSSKFPVYGTVTADNVNVRTGASVTYPIKGVVNKGQKLIVNKLQGDYYQVVIIDKYGDTNLYIYADYIQLGATVVPGETTTPSKPSATSPYPAEATVTGGFVNVRENAGTNYAILGQLYYGQKVTVVGENGDFYAAQVPDVFGKKTVYLYKEYVTIGEVTLEPSTPAAPATPAKKTGSVNSDIGCNLRKNPDSNSTRLAILDYKQTVEILEKSGDWYKVTATVDGKSVTGYCFAQYITVK